MFRSITFIRSVHTLIFVLLTAVLGVFLLEVILDRITTLSWIALALFLAEGVILLASGWRCRLTVYAESLGSTHGQVTDTFLPSWFANRVFHIYGSLFALAVALLAIRLLT